MVLPYSSGDRHFSGKIMSLHYNFSRTTVLYRTNTKLRLIQLSMQARLHTFTASVMNDFQRYQNSKISLSRTPLQQLE